MKIIHFCLGVAALLVALAPLAQAQGFAKYEIAETGYSAYFPADPGEFAYSESEDGLPIYTTEVATEDANYGLILILFDGSFASQSKEDLEGLVTSYLDFLQESFEIFDAAGYGMGHTLESHPDAIGVLDYWADEEETQYVVKAWADNKAMVVMFVYGMELPAEGYQQMYLNGFRFKEE